MFEGNCVPANTTGFNPTVNNSIYVGNSTGGDWVVDCADWTQLSTAILAIYSVGVIISQGFALIGVLGSNGRIKSLNLKKHWLSHCLPCYDPTKTRSNGAMCGARLYQTAERGDLTTVQDLLAADRSVDVNKEDEYGRTPLYAAAKEGQTAVVAALLAAPGIDVNKEDKDGRTPLHMAAKKGHTAVVAALLATPGIDVNKEHAYGKTPLHIAAMYRQTEVVAALLAAPGIDVTA